MKILLTAFEPFGGEKINPALEAVKLVNVDLVNSNLANSELANSELASSKLANSKLVDSDIEIIKLEVPTVFGKSIEIVKEAIRKEKPDVVLAVGQAGGRYNISVERLAINLDDAPIPDNKGNQPIDITILEKGSPAYFSTIPVKSVVEAIKVGGIPAEISNSAGTFVCNHLLYGILHTLATELPYSQGGFIHVPFLPEQVIDKKDTPSMSLNDITKSLELAIQAIAKSRSTLE